MTTTQTRPTARPAMTANDGFAALLRAEWTKWRSVRTTKWCAFLAVALTVLFSMLWALSSDTDANESGQRRADAFRFTHQPLAGDGEIVAHLLSQENTGPLAKAGVLIKASTEPGSPYAAMLVTPGHGARFQANWSTDIAGTPGPAPRWLKLTRTGGTVVGAESAEGVTWREVGRVDLGGLPETVEVGLFSTSPSTGFRTIRGGGNTSMGPDWRLSVATFDSVALTPATPAPAGAWTSEDIGEPITQVDGSEVRGSGTQSGGTFTLAGVGDIADLGYGGDNDIVRDSLGGILIGLIPIVCLGALFMTSEYAKGTIRTTFTASPRRVRVLVAKAVVLAVTTIGIGLAAALISLYASRPIQRSRGFAPPAYPDPSLADGPVLRAVVGAGLFLAALALLSLGVGAILRRAAAALTLVTALVVLPGVLGPLLPLTLEDWLGRLTPLAGMAIMQTRDRPDYVVAPWTGLAIIGGYAVVALTIAAWRIRRRDV
jgi:ABC-2 family transporter protein